MSSQQPQFRTRPDDGLDAAPAPAFPRSRFGREGYAGKEVDDFVAELQRACRRNPATLAPWEVAGQRFSVTRFRRGYALRPVDDYLDRAEELLRRRYDGPAAQATGATGRPGERPVRTWWVYALGLVAAAAIVGYFAAVGIWV